MKKLYAVNLDIYVEASSPQSAERSVHIIAEQALNWRRRIKRVSVGLSREADAEEVEE